MTTKYNEVKVSPKKVEKDATHAETQTRKKKVITGEIVERKKGIFERLAITMVGPDGRDFIEERKYTNGFLRRNATHLGHTCRRFIGTRAGRITYQRPRSTDTARLGQT